MEFYLKPELIDYWPSLAWVAEICAGTGEVLLRHGKDVEVGPEWAVEGVWPGEFEKYDFDLADLFFGSGVRIRPGRVIFATSHTTLSRIVYRRDERGLTVSNSLPALLVCSSDRLSLDYLDYRLVLDQLKRGRPHIMLTVPLENSNVTYVMLDNLMYDGEQLDLERKPDASREFVDFADYQEFLVGNMTAIGANVSSPIRKSIIVPICAVSSGYDSSTVAVLSRHAGCKKAFTIEQARSWTSLSDSGETIIRQLGMEPIVVRRDWRKFKDEESIWAALGDSQDLNLTIFDYPKPLSLFFSGFFGDAMWERESTVDVEQLSRIDTAGMSTCEFRLIHGVIHCPVAFWGYRHGESIKRISSLPEMRPWILGTDYDRPICRRILESAGVPRGCFAMKKKATAVSDERIWPYSAAAKASFLDFLRNQAKCGEWEILLARISCFVNLIDRELWGRLAERFKLSRRTLVEYQNRANKLIFHWANEQLLKRYDLKRCRDI